MFVEQPLTLPESAKHEVDQGVTYGMRINITAVVESAWGGSVTNMSTVVSTNLREALIDFNSLYWVETLRKLCFLPWPRR